MVARHLARPHRREDRGIARHLGARVPRVVRLRKQGNIGRNVHPLHRTAAACGSMCSTPRTRVGGKQRLLTLPSTYFASTEGTAPRLPVCAPRMVVHACQRPSIARPATYPKSFACGRVYRVDRPTYPMIKLNRSHRQPRKSAMAELVLVHCPWQGGGCDRDPARALRDWLATPTNAG
jgi:hypothetical protein